MNNLQPEIIDSSKMQVLTEFEASQIQNNIDRFRIGLLDTDVIIAGRNLKGVWSGVMLFERANAARVVNLFKNVFDAQTASETESDTGFKAGKDLVGVELHQPRNKQVAVFYNNRPVVIDNLEQRNLVLYLDPDTLLSFHVILRKLLNENGISGQLHLLSKCSFKVMTNNAARY